MNINIKLDKNFTTVFNKLKEESSEKLRRLNGFADSQLNYGDFIDNFVDKNTVADASIDGNANVGTKDITSLTTEMNKPHSKLLAFNKIFYEMNKKYGYKDATDWFNNEWDGHFYLHDSHSSTWVPYCFAYDIENLVKKGLYFIDTFNNQPPQHLTTYTDFVGEFVSWASNRSSGACGLPSFLIYSFYFWKKDVEEGYFIKSPEYYRNQEFQRIVYKLNQPYLRVNQSAFTNFSIFDRDYLIEIFGGKEFPDGSFIIDYIEEIIEYQKEFMKVVSDIRSKNMMTFPVLTMSLLRHKDGTWGDEDFARWCCKHNMKWADSNFFISDSVTSLSNCPLSGDTLIMYWSEYYNKFVITPIKDVYANLERDEKECVEVISKGKRIKCKINKFNLPANYLITLTNGATIKTTANHLNKVFGKNYVQTKDLTTDDYLPFYIKPFVDSNNMSYEDGKLVGMFLGDGSYYNNNSIVYSLHKETDEDDIEFLKDYCSKHYNAHINSYNCKSSISDNEFCVNVTLNSEKLRGLINQFVIGDNALNKSLSLEALSCSEEFRKGIIDGLYTTDGGNNNRIYTSSVNLKDSLVALFASLGIVTKVNEDNREERLGKNPCYTIRWYSPGIRKSLKNVYKIDDEFMWIKIQSIEQLDFRKNNVSYCLEVIDSNEEPIFMLPNGIHTHNCRLLSDIDELGYFNSIGGTALEVGSIKVNTINLARIAYENDKENYLNVLAEKVVLNLKCLDVVRDIIKRNIQKGLLPNYALDIMSMESQYNTIGVIGIYEVLDKYGMVEVDELGNHSYTDEALKFSKAIFDKIIEVKEEFRKQYDCNYKINIEQIPAERAAVVLMEKDKFFYPNEKYELPAYGNQWIPLAVKCTMQEKIRISALLDQYCNGGSISHINLSAPFTSFDQAWEMLNYTADAGVKYFAFCLRISACENNHGFFGDVCPHCGLSKKTSYQRIVGFLVPASTYSIERKEEFAMRTWFDVLSDEHNAIL